MRICSLIGMCVLLLLVVQPAEATVILSEAKDPDAVRRGFLSSPSKAQTHHENSGGAAVPFSDQGCSSRPENVQPLIVQVPEDSVLYRLIEARKPAWYVRLWHHIVGFFTSTWTWISELIS